MMKKATREQSKFHNKSLILNTIYNAKHISRADIARTTHLTRSTVSDTVSELIEEGLVAEIGYGQSAGGKPPVLLQVVDDARQIIGIDLASGEFRGALVNLRGEIDERINIPIDEKSGDMALEFVYVLVEKLLAAATQPIMGIGIGAPGLMDSDEGVVLTAVNLDWQDLPLVDLLQERYDLPVYIANDSQVSALAESKFGAGDKSPNLLVVKISRGVGSGIVIDHQLYQGDKYGAGEIGHIKVEEDGELCRCGNYGCLETKISSRAIRKQAGQLLAADPDSILHEYVSPGNSVSLENVYAAYQAGDPAVTELIAAAGQDLGRSLAFIISVLNINQVIVAGSMSVFEDGLLNPALDVLRKSVLPNIAHDVQMGASVLGEEIVILGAAGLVLQHELGLL